MNRREILFRGKRVDNGEWVFGSLIAIWDVKNTKQASFIQDISGVFRSEVDPTTIGQYVGKIGANSCEVWEGDKVIARLNHHGKPTTLEIPAFIDYNERVGAWQIRYENHLGELVNDNIGFRYFLEVVGTIHDTHLTKQS